ncbi:hypothetical protein BCU02_01390 [Vibrio lentus]|nr:hypothetical protein BCU02_01390 [Vibrio lentus]
MNEDEAEATKFISLPRSVYKELLPKRSNSQRDLRPTFLTICETKTVEEAQEFLRVSCFASMSKPTFSKLMRSAFTGQSDESELKTRDVYAHTQHEAYQDRLKHMQYE